MVERPLLFAFAVHAHQPVGNFSSVIEEVYKKAYLPFFGALDRFPGVHLSVHISGFLLEWLEGGGRELLKILKAMVRRGQADILTGTYYEAVIPVIPAGDAVRSILAYSDRLEEVFGRRPRGIWLAERVYEPHLPGILSDAGIEYLALDDWHFKTVGMRGADLFRPWVAEEGLERVTVFPISQDLRYLVPFAAVDECLGYLGRLYENGAAVACLADDGEKFGGWPGTAERCYGERWLETFFEGLTAAGERLRTVSLAEAYDEVQAQGPVYLSNTAYYEMGRWALPADSQVALEDLGPDFAAGGPYGYFITGAPFRNFLARYPEANYAHKRMEITSRRLAELEADGNERADIRSFLWRSQANDSYWHGVFGGIYLPHLRRAVMRNILAAEELIDRAISLDTYADTSDFDFDGNVEVTLKDRRQVLVLAPDEGLAAKEWSIFERRLCLTDVVRRRPEAYHRDVGRRAARGDDGEARTIHGELGDKVEGLEEFLIYDGAPKRLGLDRFFGPAVRESDYYAQAVPAYVAPGATRALALERGVAAEFVLGPGDGRVSVEKTVRLTAGGIEINWEYSADAPGRLGTELTLSVRSPEAGSAALVAGGSDARPLFEPGSVPAVDRFKVADELAGWTLEVASDPTVEIWHYPVYTVSRSERGYEKIYQGTTFFLSFNVSEGATGAWRLTLAL